MPTTSAPLSAISLMFHIVLAILLLSFAGGFGYLAYLLFDTAIHEFGHALVLYLMGVKIEIIEIGSGPLLWHFNLGSVPVVINRELWGNGSVFGDVALEPKMLIPILAGPLLPITLVLLILILSWRKLYLWHIFPLQIFCINSANDAMKNLTPLYENSDGSKVDIILALWYPELYASLGLPLAWPDILFAGYVVLIIFLFIIYPFFGSKKIRR